MYPHHQRPQHVERIHRVALAIENQVGRIHVHPDVGEPGRTNHAQQRKRSFLARFAAEGLAVALAVVRHVPQHIHARFEHRVFRILGEEAEMALHGWNTSRLGEVGCLV